VTRNILTILTLPFFLYAYKHQYHDTITSSKTMVDASNNCGNNSSGKYNGAIEGGNVGMTRKANDLAITVSSGENTRLDRARRKAAKETAAKPQMEEEARWRVRRRRRKGARPRDRIDGAKVVVFFTRTYTSVGSSKQLTTASFGALTLADSPNNIRSS
jgi:hypothetical protein